MKDIIIGIGACRDGTTTLFNILKRIYNLNNCKNEIAHQKDHMYIYNQFSKFKETGNLKYKNNITNKIKKWKKGSVIIGNGYCLVLDIINKIHNNQVKVIHLKRNKKDWLESFINNVNSFPWSHGNYSKIKKPKINRIAAFQFKEMTISSWNKLSLEKKSLWYYNKTHSIIDNYRKNNDKNILVRTESLSKVSTVVKITKFINKDWKSLDKTYHVNISKIDFNKLKKYEQIILGRFYANFDFLNFAENPIEGEYFFNEKIIEGYLNRKKYQHSKITKKEILSYCKNLNGRLNTIKKILK